MIYFRLAGRVVTSLFCVWGWVLLTIPVLHAQADLTYYLPEDVSYDQRVPTPKEVMGYEPGEWHVTHDQLISYLKVLAEQSERITLKEIGRTHENRPLVHLYISKPDHINRLEEIREEHLKLSDPDVSAYQNIGQMPAVAWLGFSIHGNEASGSNAALVVAYHLAAATGEAIENLLAETVIILDPCFNPDGLNRFTSWVNMHRNRTPVIDPVSREFNEVWPGGRTNHYWFDLNRDWLPARHPESQARLREFHRWKPNLLTDHHEMGRNSTFFFQPGVPSRNNPLTPKRVFELTKDLAAFHAKALDKIGSLYYTEEQFDDFYYGKGSTYPDINGGIGILFEQASSRGHIQDSDHGPLSFPFTIRNQVTTALSSLEGVYELHDDLLEYQRTFFKEAMQNAQSSGTKAWIIGGLQDKVRTFELAKLMLHHDIKLYLPTREVKQGGKVFRPNDSFIVPADQPQFRLIQAMLEERTTFTDSIFYDVSAWTLPLAFGVPIEAISGKGFDPTLKGIELTAPPVISGRNVGGKSEYAYVFSWHSTLAPKMLYALQKEGVICKVATKPFSLKNKTFQPGSILVPLTAQPFPPSELFTRLKTLSEACGADFYSVESGYASSGPSLGSNSFKKLTAPVPLMLVGSGVRAYDAGEIWYLLDQQVEVPLTMVDADRFARVSLQSYTHLIMVSGSYRRLSSAQVDKIQEWVSRGGTLIAMRSAVQWLANQGFGDIEVQTPPRPDSIGLRPYGKASEDRGANVIGGAIFESMLDLTHPLAYGYESPQLFTFRNTRLILPVTQNPYNHPAVYVQSPLRAGYVSDRNLAALPGSIPVSVRTLGRGRLVLMTDNPCFRAFWLGSQRLFTNALFFGEMLR